MAANNPRKFEEKIAQHKLRQAQETKEFEKIMEEMSFVNAIKSQAQTQRQTRNRYGGSLPDFSIAQSQSNRHENMSDMTPIRHNIDVQVPLKDRPYHRNRHVNNRRHNMDTASPYHFSPYLSPPQMDPNWRRTSSDSSLYHTLTNPNMRPEDARKMSTSPDSTREFTICNVGKPTFGDDCEMQSKDDCKISDGSGNGEETENTEEIIVGSFLAPKDNELPDIKLCPTGAQQQQQQSYNYQSTNGSLPDLTNLHIPSPLSTSIDGDEQFKLNSTNVFLRQTQPRRNTIGPSCKRQVYHPRTTPDPLQVPTSPYLFQQSVGGSSGPTSPTCGNMYPTTPMSPLANGPGYLQYQGVMGSAGLQQQLEQMATIAESLKPMNVSNGQMGHGMPPQSPNTFLTDMLSQNPLAMDMVRERFQDVVFGNMEGGQNAEPAMPNSLAQDIGDAIGGYDFGGYRHIHGDLPPGMSLAPLNIEDIEVLTGQSGDVADPEVEEEFRREQGQQQLMRQ